MEYITDRDGKVNNAYTCDDFGNITNTKELVKKRYTYNGEQYDQISQQYYLRARYYNPLAGRFTQLTKRYLKPETTKVQNGGTTTITTSMAQTEVEQYKIYEYDSFNKTAQTVVEKYKRGGKETHIQRNFYDAENLRYGIEEDGERTNFVTNGWSVLSKLDAEWKLIKRLVRGYGIVASEECGHEVEESITTELPVLDQYHFYHQNEHGDTEYITGRGGNVKNAYSYDAFGTITNSRELVKNRYTYNGEQYDQISQQYYLRARNYNPLVGRFTQEDVYRGDGLNLYAYCVANSVMYVDPSGYGSDKCGQQNSSQYPPRTKEAREEAQKVAEKMEGLISKKDHPSITVFIHENGTVSVGMSGKSGTDKIKTNSKKLQEVLGEKYNVSPDSMPTDNLIEVGCPLGNCSEPKAVNAAHSNASPITGYDTVWRGKGEMPEKYQYTGQNVGGEVEGKYKQMDPCDTCKDPENIKEYMDYANGNE